MKRAFPLINHLVFAENAPKFKEIIMMNLPLFCTWVPLVHFLVKVVNHVVFWPRLTLRFGSNIQMKSWFLEVLSRIFKGNQSWSAQTPPIKSKKVSNAVGKTSSFKITEWCQSCTKSSFSSWSPKLLWQLWQRILQSLKRLILFHYFD